MADRVVVMNGGRVEQAGRPQDLYARPASRFVAGFMGSPAMNFLPARLVGGPDGPLVRLADGTAFPVPPAVAARLEAGPDKDVVFGIRPEAIGTAVERQGVAQVSAAVDLVEPLGATTMIYFTLAGESLCACLDSETAPAAGTTVPLAFNLNQMHLFDPVGDASLLR